MAHADVAPPTVIMVSGSYPPDICGVGDYTGRLMAAAPPHWQLFVERDWSLLAAPGIIRRLLRLRPTKVVVQYPTQGYGWSLVPHLLAVVGMLTRRYHTTFALHEFSSLSRKARIALALVSHVVDRFVFTTELERDRARRQLLFSPRVPTSVIGILSNIPLSDAPPSFAVRSIDIAYFGHIRPNKGIEGFLDVMTAFRQQHPAARIAVVGEVPLGYEAFSDMVAERCRAIEAELILGLDDQAVAQLLCDIRILYLPFLDGVSARRGSVLAGLGNGALIATRIGSATPETLRPAVIACDGTPGDVPVLHDMLALSEAQAAAIANTGRHYITTCLPRDWGEVAALYDRALGREPATSC